MSETPKVRLAKLIKKERRKVASEIFKLARSIWKRDDWFIGGYLGVVEEEWDERENKSAAEERAEKARRR